MCEMIQNVLMFLSKSEQDRPTGYYMKSSYIFVGLSACRSVRNESVERGGKECVTEGKYRNANKNQSRGEMYKLAGKNQ